MIEILDLHAVMAFYLHLESVEISCLVSLLSIKISVTHAKCLFYILQNPPLKTDEEILPSVPESSKFARWFANEGESF